MNNLQYFHEFINYYKTLENPGYAILITGEWGSGKTYQINKALNNEEMYYISLFDLTSVESIYSSVFYKMSPVKATSKNAAKSIGESSIATDMFTFGIGGIIGKVANAMIKEEVKNDKIIVFDDIERCNVDINEILGIMNKYVEHHGCKLIAIAHDKKIKGAFEQSKEKIIGQTLHIEPDVEQAYNYFLANHKSSQMNATIKGIIKEVFYASGCHSLRILKFTLSDCFRLLNCLENKHLRNEVAMRELFLFFSSLSIAYRFNQLKEKDLINRSDNELSYYINKEKDPKPALMLLKENYANKNLSIPFTRPILTDEILIDTLIKGYYNQNDIVHHLNKSIHFTPHKDLQPWRILMDFDNLDAKTTNKAVEQMNLKIQKLSITNPGDIMHTFSFYLLMSHIGASCYKYKDILTKAKNYFYELVKSDVMPLPEFDDRFTSYRDSAHGYGYWVIDDYRKYFIEIFDSLDYYRNIALRRKYPSIKKEIMHALEHDIEKFFKLICPNNFGESSYAYIDVLASIDPYDFVNVWLNNDHTLWYKIKDALQRRYANGSLNHDLAAERLWKNQVVRIIESRALEAAGFDRLRLQRIVPS